MVIGAPLTDSNHVASAVEQDVSQQGQPPLELSEGDAVEVEADGEWWDAVVVMMLGNGLLRVHYVGGTDEEDEEIAIDSGRLKPAKKLEVVWAKGSDGIAWPAAVLDGSLEDKDCVKLRVQRFLQPHSSWVRRDQASAFTKESIPKRSSSKRLAEAIESAQEAIANGSLAAVVAEANALEEKEAKPAKKRARKAQGGNASGASAGSRRSSNNQAVVRKNHRLTAMRKLGLCAPLDA